MKRLILIFGIVFIASALSNLILAQVANKITKIVIDAGHGGKDPGALGLKSKEKDIVLSVALKAGKFIEEGFSDVTVVYTRTTDEFVELHRRAQIANESGADLFISIHCNSNKSSVPFGAESYVMGLHKSVENLDVAKTENAAIFYEDDYDTQYEGFNPNSDEDYIILNMFQSVNINQSINLSSKVQTQFKEYIGRKDRGVKQAGFWVLYKTTMPGILVELGFLSNPEEEKYLLSEQNQTSMASAIFKAFQEYKFEYEDANKDLKPVAEKKVQPEAEPVLYRVQFASYNKEKSIDFKKFRGLEDVKMYQHSGQYKYTTGNEQDFEKAQLLKQKLLEQGYKDVFIVAFFNEERISIQDAKRLSSLEN